MNALIRVARESQEDLISSYLDYFRAQSSVIKRGVVKSVTHYQPLMRPEISHVKLLFDFVCPKCSMYQPQHHKIHIPPKAKSVAK